MSSAEIKTQQILRTIGFLCKEHKNRSIIDAANCFYTQYPVGTYKLDFALEKAKIAIEINGEYWHGLRSNNLSSFQFNRKINDIKKISILKSNGWKVVQITASDLDNKKIDRRLQEMIFILMEL